MAPLGGGLCRSLMGKQGIRVVMNGLNAAGKSTILYRLKTGEVVPTIPTSGVNVETVSFENLEFTTWDIGGRHQHRAMLRHYSAGAQMAIFVVDSSDRDRIEEAAEELMAFVTDNDAVREVPLLVFANKQDLPNAMSAPEITDKLRIDSLGCREWHVQACCADTGGGLEEGMAWLSGIYSREKNIAGFISRALSAVPALGGKLHGAAEQAARAGLSALLGPVGGWRPAAAAAGGAKTAAPSLVATEDAPQATSQPKWMAIERSISGETPCPTTEIEDNRQKLLEEVFG